MTELGNYLIGKTIGEGTFGKVCHAKHQILGHEVAVKILEKNRIHDELDVERVKREIKILQMLHHPNVVQLYEMIETETHIYLFMEYAEGGELFDYIDLKKRINEVEACKFLHEIISAIQYIHQLRIVHRDLKPENLLLTAKKNILVVDFGLSNIYEDTLKTACGSPCYAAPEMIQGKPYHGLQTDLWSCGVILYAMVCGYLPFEDNNTQVLYKKILTADFHIPRYVSLDGKDLIKNILTVDPNKRYNIDQIKAHKWWQLWKSDYVQVSPFKASFNKISYTLLPNSIYKPSLSENVTEDEKTCCDTVQESNQTPFNEKQDSSNQLKIQEDSQQEQEIDYNDYLVNDLDKQQAVSEQQEQQDIYDYQQSVRSLTRQKSSRSIQSITRLQTQIESPQKPIILQPNKQPTQTSQNKGTKPIAKKPLLTQQQQQAAIPQKKPIAKTGPSKSLHEPPSFENKFMKQTNTSNMRSTNTTNSNNNSFHISHQMKTEIPKKNSNPPPKLSAIQEQFKENKEKSHSLKTQPNSYKQQLEQQQSLNKTQTQIKSSTKQGTNQISSIKKNHNQRQTVSIQIEGQQSLLMQQSSIEENNMVQFEDQKTIIDNFTLRLNSYKGQAITKQSQKQGYNDSNGIESISGPYNVSFITAKHPKLFIKGLQKYIQERYQLQFSAIQSQQYGFNFNLSEFSFQIKLFRIENLDIFYCQINCNYLRNVKNDFEYQNVIQDLQTNFEF
ncbi:unnamed protein product (macronuclear) [Paramecium tetraurelia]|uniref:Protein kinase domain-containing protein n=1 Tax=Paramecium tetraurelia TaxID=5888 RepID=A0BM97_PARTE|nr:uncharacterized protein GSPATT00030300001 [Paramecium tetraurelia]CAK59664.1 unnamed protein product [Paramecium tetraurelia]|eukprot:XP_001427062.1 hypothetical protein (macronuclear) [Paramecium tetraurelia strain d4-2]